MYLLKTQVRTNYISDLILKTMNTGQVQRSDSLSHENKNSLRLNIFQIGKIFNLKYLIFQPNFQIC